MEREEIFEALHTAQLDDVPRPVAGEDAVTDVVSPPAFRLNAVVASSNVAVLVGVAGFEPTTSSSRTKRATKLRYTPPTPAESSPAAVARRKTLRLATAYGISTPGGQGQQRRLGWTGEPHRGVRGCAEPGRDV